MISGSAAHNNTHKTLWGVHVPTAFRECSLSEIFGMIEDP